MVSYTCQNCLKVFTHKTKYTKHINRKFPCKRVANILDQEIPPYTVIDPGVNYNNIIDNNNAYFIRIPVNNTNNQEKYRINKCKYCNASCKVKNLHRHYRNTCDSIPEDKRQFFINKYNKHKRHLNSINSGNNTSNNTSDNISVNNITNNTTNNTTNNITNNITNITINLNAFGEEDISSIKGDNIIKILNKLYCMIPDVFKLVYFDVPENRNIYIPNINRPIVKVYNGNEWVCKPINTITEDMSENTKGNIELWSNKYKSKLNKHKKKHLSKFIDDCNKGNIDEELKKESKLYLMSYSKDIKKNL